jgi:hypothetical protein
MSEGYDDDRRGTNWWAIWSFLAGVSWLSGMGVSVLLIKLLMQAGPHLENWFALQLLLLGCFELLVAPFGYYCARRAQRRSEASTQSLRGSALAPLGFGLGLLGCLLSFLPWLILVMCLVRTW